MSKKHLGVMLDCSRNGVMNVKTVKKYIDLLQRMGYNTLMLYTEDTYEVDNQPYFGYLRGRYSQAELKELDAYALEHGVELIPCIQTLAHLDAMVRWNTYKPYVDVNNILLCGDDRTYQLIDDMFASLKKCFASKTVHIGMDEAHMVGLGKYLDQHGFQNRFQILIDHLKKVCEIAKKHGLRPIMWDDMFFRLVRHGKYYEGDEIPGEDVMSQVPEEVGMVYWDYYGRGEAQYENMIDAHRTFKNELWFAGGLWAWRGFAPKNYFTLHVIDCAVPVLRRKNVENVFFTVWGDNGKECSFLAILPSLYYAAQRMQGNDDVDAIKAGFEKEFGIPFDGFMELDLPGATENDVVSNANPEKFMFYNDPFTGICDSTVTEGFEPQYAACAEKLRKYVDHAEYGYLFDTMATLSDFLQLKYTIGVRTRKVYRSGDKAALEALIADYSKLLELLEAFYRAHKTQWFIENKPHGFDVQDIRIGGLKQRLVSCRERLEQLLAGEISVIEELEEDILPEFSPKETVLNSWALTVSANRV